MLERSAGIDFFSALAYSANVSSAHSFDCQAGAMKVSMLLFSTVMTTMIPRVLCEGCSGRGWPKVLRAACCVCSLSRAQ